MPYSPRILVIRRNRIGDMVCALPMFKALKVKYPGSRIHVLCDQGGAVVAGVCAAVDEVTVIRRGINRWHTLLKNIGVLRGHDIAIGVKGGYESRLAAMIMMSRAQVRIGFANPKGGVSFAYTHALPAPPFNEHQMETCLRLIEPLGIDRPPLDMSISLPERSIRAADAFVEKHPQVASSGLVIINVSCTRGVLWPASRHVELATMIIKSGLVVGVARTPSDAAAARDIVRDVGHPACVELDTPCVLDLAAMMAHAKLYFGQEGGAAHLAAAMNTRALLLWEPGSTVQKWKSRCDRHTHYIAPNGMANMGASEAFHLIKEALEK